MLRSGRAGQSAAAVAAQGATMNVQFAIRFASWRWQNYKYNVPNF